MHIYVLLEVEGEGDGDDDIGIGDSANKGENHFDRLHYSSSHLMTQLSVVVIIKIDKKPKS